MNKKRGNLTGELMLLILVALLVAAGVFYLSGEAVRSVLDGQLFDWKSVVKEEQRIAKRVQDYVGENGLAHTDVDELKNLTGIDSDAFFTLYWQGNPIYSSTPQLEIQILDGGSGEIPEGMSVFDIDFADGVAQLTPYALFSRYYLLATMAAGLLAFIVFMGILLYFIRKKLRYIATMESELKILGGGDLSHPITIRGNDELTSLGEEIETMRTTLLERYESEQAALEANRGLVTAMSHDLRTPLTVLIGYLEILQLDKNLEAKHRKYIESASQKAMHIKNLSDQLFEYFLVFGRDSERLVLHRIGTQDCLAEFVEGSLFDLKNRSQLIECNLGTFQGMLRVDHEMMRRVFHNLISNISKYADREKPVRVQCCKREKYLTIEFTNSLDPNQKRTESSGMGLKTCEKILQMHGGTFRYEQGEEFRAIMEIPVEG